jgi:hypothetical protein
MAPGRRYDPALGRFISADTVVPEPGNPQALNRFSYCYNNPLRYVDPTGHLTDEQIAEWLGYDVGDLQQNNPELYKLLSAMHIGDVVSTYGQNADEFVGGVFGLEWFAGMTGQKGYRGIILSEDGSRTSVSEWFEGRAAKHVALWRWGPDKQYHQVYAGSQPTKNYLAYSSESGQMVSTEVGNLNKLFGATIHMYTLYATGPLEAIPYIGPIIRYLFGGLPLAKAVTSNSGYIEPDDLIVQYWYPHDSSGRFWEETAVIRKGGVIYHTWRHTDDCIYTNVIGSDFTR